MEKTLTESDDKSPDLGQALLDLQRQLDEVIQNQSWSMENDTEDLSEGAKDSHRARMTGYQESMKKDLDELQNQVQVRMDQLENQLSLLATVMEEKPRTDSTTIIEGEPAKKSSVRDTVFGETPSNRKPAEKIADQLLQCCSVCGKGVHEVHRLAAAPNVFICNDCVEFCNGIVSDENQQENPPKRHVKPTSCSFCNKSDDEVEEILTGPSVSICNECVEISNRIIAERQKRDVSAKISNTTDPVVEAEIEPVSNNPERNKSDDIPEVEKPERDLLTGPKKIFGRSENEGRSGWAESSSKPGQEQQTRSGRVSIWIFSGYCCLGLLLGAASTVVMLYGYPDIWVIGLPRILFSTVIALILLMVVMGRVRSDLPILVTLSVAALVGWYVTLLYLTSFAEFQFLRSVMSENSDLTMFLILGGLACVGLSFVSRKVFRVCSYLYAGIGAFMGIAIAGSV